MEDKNMKKKVKMIAAILLLAIWAISLISDRAPEKSNRKNYNYNSTPLFTNNL